MENKKELSITLGQKIKELRKIKNLTQDDFEVSREQLSKYESGKTIMSAHVLKDICIKLETSADYLLGLKNHFDSLDPDKQIVWSAIKNMNHDQIQKIKGMLIYLAMENNTK